MLDVIVGFSLVDRQLLAAVLQAEHPQMVVEPLLVDAVLTFNLPVVTRGGDANAVVENVVFLQLALKQALVVGIIGDQCLGELSAVVCLYLTDREGTSLDQLNQELLRAVGVVFVVHLPVSPAGTLVYSGELVVLPPVDDALAGHELHIHLHLLPRIFRPLVWFVLSSLPLLVPLRGL